MNYYKCSDGSKVSEATIQKKLSDSYKETYTFNPKPYCMGCGKQAIESSHILAKAYVKSIGKTELIWNPENVFPSCRNCHMAWEAINNPDWCKLHCVELLLKFIKKHDNYSYIKRKEIYDKFRGMETS